MNSLRNRFDPPTVRVGLAATVLAIGSLTVTSSSVADTYTDPNFSAETIATVAPFSLVGMAWAPDGRLFVWQKNGVVRIIKNGVLLSTPFIDLSGKVNTFDDRGMWGLTFHPDFANNGYVYLSYTFENTGNTNNSGPKTSRVTRVTSNPVNRDVALANSEVVVLGSIGTPPCDNYPAGSDCIPADGGSHTLGSVVFGPDGKLYVGVGDGADVSSADPHALRVQDLGSWSGKILRLNADGTAPGDNPFDDGTNSIRSRVYLYGVRNPFRFHFHPTTGEPYFGDVGWNTWEEVNRGIRGGNFGWPCYEGAGPQPDYQSAFALCAQLPASAITPPLFTYSHDTLGSAAIGGPFYTGSVYPQTYQGSLFFADYVGNWIRRMVFNPDGTMASVQVFATNVPSPVTIEQGPDGLLYYLSFTTGEIRRIRFNGVIAQASANPTHGYSPLQVSFSSAGSSAPGGGQLTYLWNFGDGTTSTAANPTHTYTNASVVSYTATLTVSNGGFNSSATVKITINSDVPTPTISAPVDGTEVRPGQTVNFSGSAYDPDDGQLPPSALSWQVLLHHNTHVHTFVGGSGTQGSFVAENHGPIGTYSYEIILTATDSSGLSASTSINLPVVADTVAPTAPSTLVATAVAANQINLNWAPATDDVAVASYQLERCQGAGCSNFAQIAAPTATSFSDSSVVGSTTYSYRVRAADATGNLSGYSNVSTATTQAPIPVTGLMAAYAFNEGMGTTAADASGNGNTGTLSNTVWTPQGKYGSALEFNGTNSLVAIPASATLNVSSAMTLEAWVYPTAAQSGWRTIMQRQVDAYFLNASNSGGPLLPSGGGTLGGSQVYVSASNPLAVNTWTHVALTYDGSALRLYVNGTLVASGPFTGAIQTNSNPLRIGGNVPYGEFFQGRIDEVRVYNRALSAGEVQTDMNTSVGAVVPDTTAPTAPSGLTATASGTTQINLAWVAATDNVGVASYRVERCQGTGCSNFTQIATPTATLYNDTGLVGGTSYSYRVRAADAAGNLSSYSGTATTTTVVPSDAIPPTAPTSLAAAASSSTQVNLSWTASTDNVGVSGYRVERCTGAACGNFAQVGTSTSSSFSDTALSGNTSYSYRVLATDAAGNLSGYSNVASATTPTAPPVTGLVAAYAFNEGTGAAAGDSSGNGNTGTISGATWTSQGKFGGALQFDGVNDLVAIPASSSLNVATAMTLEGWVYPTASQSGWRTIMQRQTDSYFLNASNSGGPLWPSGGGTLGGSAVYVSASSPLALNIWTHVALTYDGTTLRLYVNGSLVVSGPAAGAIETNTNPLRIGGNVPYGEFFQGRIDEIRVYSRALNQGEIQSDMSTSIGVIAPDTTPPTAPPGLTATASSSTQISVSWTAASDNVGVTGYQLERCQDSSCSNFLQIATPGTTSYTDSGLAASTSYSYRARAVDAAGNLGGYSPVGTALTLAPGDTTPPSAPSSLAATVSGSTQINLSWTAATDNVGVTGYRVERCQGAGCSTFGQIATPTGTTFNNTGLTAGTSYSYRVRAVDAAGNLGAYSNVATGTTAPPADTTPPTAPTSLVANASSSVQVDLSWGAATDNVGVTGYRVERCQGASCSNFAQIGTPTVLSFSDTTVTAGTTYRYRVRATDAAGNLGPYSSIANATPPVPADTTPPSAPGTPTASVISSSQINLIWTAATDNLAVTGYRVERCQAAGCSSFAQVATPAGTTFNDTGLLPSTSYSYRVRAADAAGNLGAYSGTVSATTQAASPTTGLVAAYSFNEGSGTTVADASGNGNLGAINGATWTTQGKYGNALSFNGTSNMVVISGSTSLNITRMTLEAWVYPLATQSGWRTIMQRETDAYFLNANFDGGTRQPAGGATFGTGTLAYVTAPSSMALNAWSHVALTYDGSTLRLYVNGVQVRSASRTGNVQTNGNPLRIGGNVPYGEFFNGRLDEIRVYNRALSAAEVQSDMNTPVGP